MEVKPVIEKALLIADLLFPKKLKPDRS